MLSEKISGPSNLTTRYRAYHTLLTFGDSMAIIHNCSDQNGNIIGYMIFCTACGCGHLFDARWTFNGNYEKSTFRPSMLVHGWPHDPDRLPEYRVQKRCHSFVTDGNIEYLSDCEHEYAGKTIPLESRR